MILAFDVSKLFKNNNSFTVLEEKKIDKFVKHVLQNYDKKIVLEC